MRPRGYIRGRGQIETYEPRGATARKRRWGRGRGRGKRPPNAWILVESSPLTPFPPWKRILESRVSLRRLGNGKNVDSTTRESSRARERAWNLAERIHPRATGTTIGQRGKTGEEGEREKLTARCGRLARFVARHARRVPIARSHVIDIRRRSRDLPAFFRNELLMQFLAPKHPRAFTIDSASPAGDNVRAPLPWRRELGAEVVNTILLTFLPGGHRRRMPLMPV